MQLVTLRPDTPHFTRNFTLAVQPNFDDVPPNTKVYPPLPARGGHAWGVFEHMTVRSTQVITKVVRLEQ